MSGKVLKVLKAQNASENGETLIIVEAMVEHQLTSPRDGVIAAVHVKKATKWALTNY